MLLSTKRAFVSLDTPFAAGLVVRPQQMERAPSWDHLSVGATHSEEARSVRTLCHQKHGIPLARIGEESLALFGGFRRARHSRSLLLIPVPPTDGRMPCSVGCSRNVSPLRVGSPRMGRALSELWWAEPSRETNAAENSWVLKPAPHMQYTGYENAPSSTGRRRT